MAAVKVLNEKFLAPWGKLWNLAEGLSVPGEAVVKTAALDLTRSQFFGVWVRAVGAAADLRFEWHEAPRPFDDDFVLTNVIVSTLVPPDPLIFQLQPPPMLYGRLVLIGNPGNSADAVGFGRVFLQGGSA